MVRPITAVLSITILFFVISVAGCADEMAGDKKAEATKDSKRFDHLKKESDAQINNPDKVIKPIDGTLVHMETFPAKFVEPRPVDVWLPEGYDAAADQRYAVIYMHDGQMMFDQAASELGGTDYLWDVDKAISRLLQEEKIRPAIVVSVWNLPKTKRRTEYMPQKPLSEGSDSHLAAEGSDITFAEVSSDNYLKFLVEELKPYIDENYPTLADKDNTFIIGSSMGGMISAYAIAEYPEVFGGAACLSTHWNLAGGVILDWYQSHWPKAGSNRVYFDYGTETLDADYEPYQMQMDAIMRDQGYRDGEDWLTRKFEGADHSPRAWRERLHIPLEFLLGTE